VGATTDRGCAAGRPPRPPPLGWIAYLVAFSLTLLGALSVFAVVIGLPGTWLLIALAVGIELSDHLWSGELHPVTFGWWVLGTCVALAALGELLEFLAGALGAKRGGSSRRGMFWAVVGGIVGGIVGAPFGLVIGAFVGAAIGTFAGAVLGELGTPGRRFRETLRPATSASVGRILGTLSKLPIAVLVWITLSVAAFVP
jgi:uncharacterized protein YqgC (DUF456 family)